ncbi:MAG: DUF3575 domain-containing protein [Rikenellaceae bacterium]
MRNICIVAFLICCGIVDAAAQKRLDVAEVHFPVNVYTLNHNFRDNAESLVEISSMLGDEKFMKRVDRISIFATTSPEGTMKLNFNLSKMRASSLKRYIMWHHADVIDSDIDLRSYPGSWSDLAMYVAKDPNVPVKDEILWLMTKQPPTVDDDTIAEQIKTLLQGRAWDYLSENHFHHLRASWVAITMKQESPVGAGYPFKIASDYPSILPYDAEKLSASYDEVDDDEQPKKFALKTNVLYGAVAFAPNLAFEIGLGQKTTLDLSFGYNWFNRDGRPGDNKKRVHYLIEPEFRYFFKERFNGHFMGVHGLFSQFNISKFEMPYLFGRGSSEYRYEGIAFGGGISYGYQYQVNNWFAVEGTVGLGYARIMYDTYEHPRCGLLVDSGAAKNYFGPTRAGVSLIFYLK